MITLTETAAERVKILLKNRHRGVGLRLGVRTSGCSGLAYVFEYADQIGEHDIEMQDKNCTILIDKKDLVYLDGTEIDYVHQGLNEGFEFKNPNSKGECGCGESFSV
jgi:iron-sulfur cluster assembly protein